MKLAIFAVIIVVVFTLLLSLPTIVVDKDAIVSSSAFTYIRAALYFIPVDTVTTIGGLILAFWVFRVIVAIIKVLWDLLPVA